MLTTAQARLVVRGMGWPDGRCPGVGMSWGSDGVFSARVAQGAKVVVGRACTPERALRAALLRYLQELPGGTVPGVVVPALAN